MAGSDVPRFAMETAFTGVATFAAAVVACGTCFLAGVAVRRCIRGAARGLAVPVSALVPGAPVRRIDDDSSNILDADNVRAPSSRGIRLAARVAELCFGAVVVLASYTWLQWVLLHVLPSGALVAPTTPVAESASMTAAPELQRWVQHVLFWTAATGLFAGVRLPPVGLTGGIASGKSTVSALLKRKGITVIDADALAREVVMPGTPGYAAIVRHFGREVLQTPGAAASGGVSAGSGSGGQPELDRAALGRIVFSDAAKRRRLNAITHPAISRLMLRRLVTERLIRGNPCVLDAALLVDSAVGRFLCWPIIAVEANEKTRLERLRARNPELSREDAARRIVSQRSDAERRRAAQVVLRNDGSLEQLHARVSNAWRAVAE